VKDRKEKLKIMRVSASQPKLLTNSSLSLEGKQPITIKSTAKGRQNISKSKEIVPSQYALRFMPITQARYLNLIYLSRTTLPQ